MNNIINKSVRHYLKLGLLCLLALSFDAPAARAGLTFDVHLIRYNHGQSYRFFTPLSTNSTPPAAPLGTYFISSPFYSLQQSTNGSWREIEVSTNGVSDVAGVENQYTDFNSVMRQITNGTWTILFTNAITTNLYTFSVSAPNMTSNMLHATIITFPSDGALNIPNQPTFTLQGPTNIPLNDLYSYVANYDFSFYQPASIPAGQTNWTITTPIPNGLNCTFSLTYITNQTTPVFVATTPLNTNAPHTAISGWASASTLDTGDSVSFAVTNPPAAGISLIAHYTFDNSGNLGQDTSGHGYHLNYNGGSGVTSSGTAIAGSGAASFDGGSFFSYTSTPSNVLSALAGDFTLSFWIKTTHNDGNENGPAYAGAGIVTADVPGLHYDLVPAALDGGQIGFNTGLFDDTINSVTDVNNGNYHHVVITRNQTTGEKRIYIDGVLNNSQFATLNPLSDPHLVAIGCQIDASKSNPANAGTADYFQGLLDDIQIYSGVLSSNAVSQLYANPGSTPAVPVGPRHTLIAHYAFDDSGNHGLDSSGNFNDINCGSGWGPGEVFSTDALAGGGALQFFGGSSIVPCNESFTSWTNALSGSFTVSAWIKTTNVVGNDGDNLSDFNGQSIVYADNNTLGATPVALTGHKVAFRTTDSHGHDDTLHSIQSVTSGSYVHVVSTRDQITGEKKIYINGALDNSDVATSESLSGAQYVSIGGELFSPYSGLVDDVQIYSGVLSSNDVAYLFNNHGQTVSNVFGPGGMTAHYDFDEHTVLAPDVSGNDNNIIRSGNFGAGSGPTISSTNKAGVGSVSFLGSSDGGSGGYLTTAFSLVPSLAGSFTISLWVNTTNTFGSQYDMAYNGAGIVSADVGGLANDLVPVALTGGQVAFNTGTPDGDNTSWSSTTVNDGVWHHVVVSRNQPTGEKNIYIDGVLETSDTDTTNVLNDPQLLTIGAISDAGNSDPASPGYNGYNGFSGLLDDIQVYNRVLGSNEVAYLYNNPGNTVFVVETPVPLPVQLFKAQNASGNFQFSFLSQAGFTNAVQYRTNLVTGSNWQTYSNVIGNGALKTIPIPLSVFNPAKQGFVRVSTQ